MIGLASRPGTAVLPMCTVTCLTPASAVPAWLRSLSNCRGHRESYATTTAGMFTAIFRDNGRPARIIARLHKNVTRHAPHRTHSSAAPGVALPCGYGVDAARHQPP